MMTAVAFEVAQLDAYERHCELEVDVEVRAWQMSTGGDASGHALLFKLALLNLVCTCDWCANIALSRFWCAGSE